MEFTRLADVAVVETATDDDKVLIEQNGEIKRVPKTEVGGAGGNVLIVDVAVDMQTQAVTGSANMALDEAIAAITNRELTGVMVYVCMNVGGQGNTMCELAVCADYSNQLGAPSIMLLCSVSQLQLMWTADGFAIVS